MKFKSSSHRMNYNLICCANTSYFHTTTHVNQYSSQAILCHTTTTTTTVVLGYKRDEEEGSLSPLFLSLSQHCTKSNPAVRFICHSTHHHHHQRLPLHLLTVNTHGRGGGGGGGPPNKPNLATRRGPFRCFHRIISTSSFPLLVFLRTNLTGTEELG